MIKYYPDPEYISLVFMTKLEYLNIHWTSPVLLISKKRQMQLEQKNEPLSFMKLSTREIPLRNSNF